MALLAATFHLFTADGVASIPKPAVHVVLSAALTIGLVPLIVLFVFILRTATVTRRTAATIPFTAPSQEK